MRPHLKTKTKKMKKVLFVLAVAGVMVSCGNKKKSETPAEVKDTITTTTTTTTTTTATTGVPTFADPDVQKFVNDYTAFVNSYIDAYNGKDMTKVSQLAANYQQWSGQIMTIGQKLAANPDDEKKFNDYMTKLSQDWANAAQAMMPPK